VAGHTPFRVLREQLEARPGSAERLEAARLELEREHSRFRWRAVRLWDALRRSWAPR